MDNEEYKITALRRDSAYTFIRVMKGVDELHFLEVVNNVCNWTLDMDNAVAYFIAKDIPDELVLLLNKELESTRKQGYHIWVTEFDLTFGTNPNAREPKRTLLLPL